MMEMPIPGNNPLENKGPQRPSNPDCRRLMASDDCHRYACATGKISNHFMYKCRENRQLTLLDQATVFYVVQDGMDIS